MFVYVSLNMFACKFRIDVLNHSLNDLNGERYYISQLGDDAKIYCTETKCPWPAVPFISCECCMFEAK